MSGELSEGSGPSSFSTATTLVTSTNPPAMDETLFQPQLFYAFLKFLMAHKAHENLVFMKHTYLFTLLNRPLKEKYMAASKIVWTFLCESSPTPVNLSAETLKKLSPVVWERNGIALVKQDMFVDAFNEVKLMLNPLFGSWITTNEWTHLPFFHAQPPTVHVIAKIPSLQSAYEAFLKARSEDKKLNTEATALDCKLFKSICELTEIVTESKKPDASSKEVERKARHYIRSHKAELSAYPNMDEVEMPQTLHHKKKQSMVDITAAKDDAGDGKDESSLTCLDYVTEALDVLAEEMTEHDSYEVFLEERNWDPMEVMKVSLQQSHDKEGNVEIPSLAAVLHSPTYGPLLTNTFKDTEKFEQMRFLLEAHEYYARFRDTMKKHRSQDKKEMQNEARRIFDRYISKNTIEISKGLKAEIVSCVFSISSRKINPLVFQRAGAWLYNRISCSWLREVNTLLLWADHDFDNHSQLVLEMEQLYNIAHIPDLDLKLVPHPDDVIGNPDLWESFKKFVPVSDLNRRCLEFIRCSKNLSQIAPESLMIEVQSLVSQLKSICKDVPELAPMQAEIESHAINLSTFNPASFGMPCHMVLKVLLEQYYHTWTAKCRSSYTKSGSWTPVKSLTFFGNESISGTSCIPSIGISASVSGKKPIPASIDKKRWGFGLGKLKAPPSPNSSGTMPSPTSPSVTNSNPQPIQRKSSVGSNSFASGSKTPPAVSTDSLLCRSRDTSVSDDESPHSAHSNVRLPSSVLKSVPKFTLEIPTLAETLASTHLRRLFYATFLDLRLGDEERALWNALCKFHADFANLSDAEIPSHQKDISDAAMKILKDFPHIPCHDELVEAIKQTSYPFTSRFFNDAEVKLYTNFHNNYQSFLQTNRWQHPKSSAQ